ncbi:helix-turn-helix domain-containing protein [Clostridium sp. Mt-5]|uniref:Helix-turn-helix domain-containing protein n=1 Tax=Clostridium moutaii TaxID=3240932 RepID=A0ABV4BRN7_9CLOT
MSKIGDNIKNLRKHFNMSIRELSEKSKVGQSTISEIETGKATNPKSETLSKIVNVFNLPIDILFVNDALEVLGNPITRDRLKNWDKNHPLIAAELKEFELDNKSNSKEHKKRSDEIEFKTPQEAMQFILNQPAIAGYGGFDPNKMSDEEIMDFANELLNQLKLLGYKYKK